MNYTIIYKSLVTRARNRAKPDVYCERHHVLPKSMGGTDYKDNTVWFTGKEHFIAHWLLFKIHRSNSMAFAWYRMTHTKNSTNRYTSRSFVFAKKARAVAVRLQFAGKKLSESHKKKLSLAKKGKTYSEMGRFTTLKGRRLADSHKEKLRIISAGRKHTAETKEKCRTAKMGCQNPNFGKKTSDKSKRKISQALTGRTRDYPNMWANNTSGIKGVSRSRGGWQASIYYAGKTIYLGRFKTKEDAAEARRLAEVNRAKTKELL